MFVAVVGGRANAKRTLAFEEAFCSEPGGLLRKHFSRLGKGEQDAQRLRNSNSSSEGQTVSDWGFCAGQGQLLVNESSSTCKLHANGHQHLEGAVITLTMLRRHELASLCTLLAAASQHRVLHLVVLHKLLASVGSDAQLPHRICAEGGFLGESCAAN